MDANVDTSFRGQPHASGHAPAWIELSDRPVKRRGGKKLNTALPKAMGKAKRVGRNF
jgi:hypothetical protein